MRWSFALAALIATVAPAAASAAQVSVDARHFNARLPDDYSLDVLANLTPDEARNGACLWFKAEGQTIVYSGGAVSDARPAPAPRGQPAGGWWLQAGCTNATGNSVEDGAARIAYQEPRSETTSVTAYLLDERTDAVLAQDTIKITFLGLRLIDRAARVGPPPSAAKPGARRLELRATVATDGTDGSPAADVRSYLERSYRGSRLSLRGVVKLGPRRGGGMRITSGSGSASVTHTYKGRIERLRFAIRGGGQYVDDPFVANEPFAGPFVRAVVLEVVASNVPSCPKGRAALVYLLNAAVNMVGLEACGIRDSFIALTPIVDVKFFKL